jgi:hypothetical protein
MVFVGFIPRSLVNVSEEHTASIFRLEVKMETVLFRNVGTHLLDFTVSKTQKSRVEIFIVVKKTTRDVTFDPVQTVQVFFSRTKREPITVAARSEA